MPELAGHRQTVITVVFVPHRSLERTVLTCLGATEREFPTDRRIAGLDAATPAVRHHCPERGWEVLELPGGPPRLGRFLEAAVALADTPVIWTVEHDTAIGCGARDAVSAKLLSCPDVGGIECYSMRNGRPITPCNAKRCEPYDAEIGRVLPTISLNCVCWRLEALRAIDWTLVPDWPHCDRMVSRAVRRAGWELCLDKRHTCEHYYVGARRFLPAELRYLKAGANDRPTPVAAATV